MKINIASTHRFHLLDLARELEKQGHNVKFYSYVPTRRCQEYGLKIKCCKSILWLVAPLLVLHKIFPKVDRLLRVQNVIMDFYMSFFMRKCDVYIALGTVYKKSFSLAKKHNAITIMEWGSKHIDEQQKILSKIHAPINKEYFNRRSRDGYELVDYISIASEHVKESFLLHNVPENKLLINPYGVDLSMFSPTKLNFPKYDIIMVGGWSLRKGCDLLIELCTKYNYSFLHVGSIVDIDFPFHLKNVIHVSSVNQKELIKYYSQAKVFVLPSREEGLAMVQAQALACGLPIVCSKDTGGRDLRNLLKDKKWIIEMQDFSVEELDKCIKEALQLSQTQTGERNYAHDDINNLTWETYGKRYNVFLQNLIAFK